MTEMQKNQILEMRSNGMGYGTIAATLSVSEGTVKSFCRRHQPIAKSLPNASCKQCGNVLQNTPGHRQKIFCSEKCRQLYWREHHEQMQCRALIRSVCPACGKSFSDYAGHNRKYCSHACYIAARYRKAGAHEAE